MASTKPRYLLPIENVWAFLKLRIEEHSPQNVPHN